jgi:hypothetical protein
MRSKRLQIQGGSMKNPAKRRPSPGTVLAIVALIAALAGTADAARKISSKQLRNNAVTTKKIKKKAVTTSRLANRAVTAGKLGNRAVTNGKLADGAVSIAKLQDGSVTTGKLAAGERSEGFVTNVAAQVELVAATDATVASLNLPAGAYVVTAATALGNNGAVANLVTCTLRDDGAVVATGYANLAALAVFSQSITLTGTSNGGAVSLVCQPDAGAQAKSRVITATRVGALQAQ